MFFGKPNALMYRVEMMFYQLPDRDKRIPDPKMFYTKEYIEQGNTVFSGTVEEFDNYIQPNTLVVSLGAAPLVADIQELPGVVRVEELGGPRFRIQFSDVKEAMNSIVEASYTRDWQLMELQQEKSSLDTIFAELSKK